MRAALYQKIATKISVANQLYDMSEQNLKRLNGDISFVESLIEKTQARNNVKSGGGRIASAVLEPPPIKYKVDGHVAAKLQEGAEMILAKIVKYSALEPDLVTVRDVDDSNKTEYQLSTSHVQVLPISESVTAAKSRLPKSSTVLAIYPGTTTFYKGVLMAAPSASTTANDTVPIGTIVCTVKFDDDVDADGNPLLWVIETRKVFVTS